jgi:hypothetical protein
MAVKTPAKWTATLMQERLRRHYIGPEPMPGGVYLPEVTLGAQGGRRVDGLYVGFFASRGHHLIGHEIKVTRADWLHELAQPGKAEEWASQCHAWYVVAPSTDIVRVEELPEGWGLMVPGTRTITRLDIVVKAKVHEGRQPSWIATHSVLKKMDTERMKAIADGLRKAKLEARAEADKEVEFRVGRDTGVDKNAQRVIELQRIVDGVEAALGVTSLTSGYGWGDQFPVEHLGAAMGAYLRANRDLDRALSTRIRQVENAEHLLAGAAAEAKSARVAVELALRASDGVEPHTN